MTPNGEQDRSAAPLDNAAGGADLAALRDGLERRGERLADAAIWYIGHRVAGALAHAHAVTDDEGNPAPAVHLGLRPDDVMIAWDGRVRLINRAGRPGALAAPAGARSKEEPAQEYMAPEQREGARVTHRTDVYRLGLLLWSLLTWRRPPSDGARPEALSAARADLPKALVDAIDAALEPSPSRRRITCLELEQWIATIANAGAGERALREHLAALRAPHPKTTATGPESATAATTETATADSPALKREPTTETATETATDTATETATDTATDIATETATKTATSPAAPDPPATLIDPPILARASRPAGPLSPAAFASVALVVAALIVLVGVLAGDHMHELAP